jgi:hypothetical protein
MEVLIDTEIKPKYNTLLKTTSKPINCKLVKMDSDKQIDYKIGLKSVDIYTGQKTITEFFYDNLSHVDMKHILTLLQFIHEYLQDEYGDTMSDKYIIVDDIITSFGWRGFGYIKYLAKIFNTENIVNYMEGYMNIDVESMIKMIDLKSEDTLFEIKQVGKYTIEYEYETDKSIGTMSIYTQNRDYDEVIICNEYEIGLDENNAIVNIDVFTDKQTFDNITENDIDNILKKCEAIVKVYLE